MLRNLPSNILTAFTKARILIFRMNIRAICTLFFTFLLGSIVSLVLIHVTSAHGGDTSLIHGCVGTGVLNQGRLRIISASGTCNSNETPLDWRSYDPSTEPPFVCISCDLTFESIGDKFVNRNFSHSSFYLSTVNINLNGSKFNNANFDKSTLTPISAINTDFTDASMNEASVFGTYQQAQLIRTKITNATASGAYFGSATLTSTDFTGSNASGAIFENSILSNVNFTNTNLQGAVFINTTRSGITWSNTTCPDGTNSNNNGNTCEGHL